MNWKIMGIIRGPQRQTVRYRWRGAVTAIVIPVDAVAEDAVAADVDRRAGKVTRTEPPIQGPCVASVAPGISRAPRLGIARMRLGDLVDLARAKYAIDATPEMGRNAIMQKIREAAHV